MKYNIRHLDWFKRRIPTQDPRPVKVEIENIELVLNSRCKMIVEFDDGNVYEFDGRVQHNEIKDTWTVHGFNHHGQQCFVDIIE